MFNRSLGGSRGEAAGAAAHLGSRSGGPSPGTSSGSAFEAGDASGCEAFETDHGWEVVLRNLVLSHIAEGMHARSLARSSMVARPADEAARRSGGFEPARVLLVGSGITTGWGVLTHGLALSGNLQQVLQQALQLDVDVEQVSDVGVLLHDAAGLLGSRGREQWDVIVLAFGFSDVLHLTSGRVWAQGLERLLARLDADLPRGPLVPILVAGIPPVAPVGTSGLWRSVFARHARQLNSLTVRAVESNRRTSFVPLPEMAEQDRRPEGSPAAYRPWAEVIGAAVARLLPIDAERVARAAPSRPRTALPAAALDDANGRVRAALHGLAARVRDATNADLALINLCDDDRVWNVADSLGSRARSVPIASTICEDTLQEDLLHIPDTAVDPRSRSLPTTSLLPCTSYAGVALRDAHGRAIGTLCVFDGDVRGSLDLALLRRSGREVERQLARLASPVGGGALFPQRAAQTLSSAASPERVAPTLVGGTALAQAAPALHPGQDDAAPQTSSMSRRRRLRIEGSRLADTAARRSMPDGRDVRIQGPQPVRVLLLGGDYAVGWGTRTRADALDGALARLLHTRTGRGVTVVNRSVPDIHLEQLATSLGPAGAHTFDLVIWAPTYREAARSLLRSRWIAGLGLLLRKIDATSSAAVILLGFPALIGNQPLAVIGRTRAAQINRLLRLIVRGARSGAVIEPPPIVLRDVETIDGATVYQDVAVGLLPTAIQLLQQLDSATESSPHSSQLQLTA